MAITSNATGDLIAIGESQGPFPGAPGGISQPFVIKISATTGNFLWLQQFQDYSASNGLLIGVNAVTVGPGNSIVVGGTSTEIGNLLCQGLCIGAGLKQQAFIAQLDDAMGSISWVKDFGTGAGDGVTSVAIAPDGSIFATGFTNGIMATGFTQPTDNFFILKLNQETVLWAQQFGAGPWKQGPEPGRGIQAATGPNGQLYVAAETEGSFSGYSNPTAVSEIFVASFGN